MEESIIQIFSLSFVLFFLCTGICYYIVPRKAKIVVLLCTSYLFYGLTGGSWVNLLYLIGITLITYCGGIGISYCHKSGLKKFIFIFSLILNISILAAVKYLPPAFSNGLFSFLPHTFSPFSVPLGISFIVFQSTSYLFELYRASYAHPEKNLIYYAAFVSFFPVVSSGPILRGGGENSFVRQLRKNNPRWNIKTLNNIKYGFWRAMWGVFQKLVLADRISIYVNEVFKNYVDYTGWILIIGVFAFSAQIYFDFSGYSDMAIGFSQMLGFSIPENFLRPYLAKSIQEFWRRWHISLSSWFRDYLYIPLGGNRKGAFRKYINILIVFAVSGIWHGAGSTFLIWGLLHGTYQIIGILTKPYRKKCNEIVGLIPGSVLQCVWQRVCTFILVSFAWIFFRSPTLADAFGYIQNMLRDCTPEIFWDQSLYTLGISRQEFWVVLIAIILFSIVSLQRERGEFCTRFERQPLWMRWLCYLGLLVTIFVFGMYGPGLSAGEFIYAGF